MNRIAQAIALALFLLLPVYAAEETPPLRDVVDHVAPSVVGVIVELSEPAEPSKEQNQGPQAKTRDGTGMVFSSEGHIVTAIHVVEKANKITVVFPNNNRSMAQVVGTDPVTGIAMLNSKEIGFTVLSMSTSLIAVFLPILLMGGIIGKLFREFAVTLSVAIAVSLLVSLTTTPMLCARFLKSRDESRHGRLYRIFENAFQWVHYGTTPPCAGYCATSG